MSRERRPSRGRERSVGLPEPDCKLVRLALLRGPAQALLKQLQQESNGVLPRAAAGRAHVDLPDNHSDAQPNGGTQAAPDQAAPDQASSHVTFFSKSDMERMRAEMRESNKQRSREKDRRRTEREQLCPLFLSQRLRHQLEVAFAEAPNGLDSPLKLGGFDGARLEDNVAKALAHIIIHNNVPPSYVQYCVDNMQHLFPDRPSTRQLYDQLLGSMQRDFGDDTPTGAVLHPLDTLPALRPTTLDMKVEGGQTYGVAGLNKEEVVMQIRNPEDRRKPRAWFGEDGDVVTNTYTPKPTSTKLPIARHKEEICRMIQDNPIVLIQGETGCGKTTQVPQYILEAACREEAQQRRPVRIVVTQPRRIAAITVAKRVAEELGETVGKGVVGYKIRGSTVASPKCKLLFCTTGVVLRRLANEGFQWMFSPKTVTHLLVDEVHERGVDTDFMLTFLKITERKNLRVVLMSATMDTECFLKYFSSQREMPQRDGTTKTQSFTPPMVICKAFCHPVAEVYMEGVDERLGRNKHPEAKSPDELRRDGNNTDNDGIDYELIMQVIEEIERCQDGAWTFAPGQAPSNLEAAKGAVLIFLPGLGEIQQMMTALQETSSMASKWWVLALHANLPPEEQQTCFQTELPHGCTRKIICSTNVAETSVTVPDVTVVIDTCRERRNQVDRFSTTPMLREQWCALDSLKQRRGRAGRVQPGVCFRMLPQKHMERLEAVTPPEMQRVPLENVYLQVCASGIEDRPAFLAKTPDPPDDASVNFAEVALEDMGALDASEPDGLTPLGRHLASLPCHPRLGKILVLGCLLGVPGPCLSICAAMSARSPLLTTQDKGKRDAWQSARMDLVEKMGVRSDHCAWAHIVHQWRFGEQRQRQYCKELGLSHERMCSAMFERKHLCESLVQIGLLPTNFLYDEWYSQDEVPDWTLVRAAVVGGLFPNIIKVERSAPRFQSTNPADKAKWLKFSILQRHVSKTEHTSYWKALNLHPNSLCFGQDQYHYPWLAFYTIQHTTKLYAYDVSEVNPYALMLFGTEPTFNDHYGHFEVGGCAHFACKSGAKIVPIIKAARRAWLHVLKCKLENVNYDLSASRELGAIVQLLKTNGLGFRSPSPPRPKRDLGEPWSKEDEFNEHENEISYMLRKDKEHEEKMNAAWSAAKRSSGQ